MRPQLTLVIFFLMLKGIIAQENQTNFTQEAPKLKLTRAEENYAYLKATKIKDYQKTIFDPLKYIPLSRETDIYLSLGGQFRPRYEHFSNRLWAEDENQNFYSQRLALHTNFVLGKHLRLFGELYHGYTSHEREFAQYDQLDLFQAFVEIKIPIKEKEKLQFRFGRQELGLGATRLVGIREGPNIRRSFDMINFTYSKSKTKIKAFYGREVTPTFGSLDNEFTLFDKNTSNPKLWGLYNQFPIRGVFGMNEVYYLGFQANEVTFNDINGNETRHTIGFRRFGNLGKSWKYNSEINFQFGSIDGNNIRAFSVQTDWKYILVKTNWKWTLGLKFDYTSGDKQSNDDTVNSFNPMFVNPAFYSLAATVTPVNLIGLHPSITAKPKENIKLYFEWAIFWRASDQDALYRPTRFINRSAQGSNEKFIGNQVGTKMQIEINRNMSFDLDISYFFAGSFLEETGEHENILHIAPTMNFRF